MSIRSWGKAIAGLCVLAVAACVSSPPPPPLAPVVATVAPSCAAMAFDIYFEVGSAGLSAPAATTIDEIVAREKGCTYSQVEIVGHADATGAAQANAALSVRRADNVAERLIAGGIDAGRIRIKGVGDAAAVTDLGRIEPMNRRTEVRLIP